MNTDTVKPETKTEAFLLRENESLKEYVKVLQQQCALADELIKELKKK